MIDENLIEEAIEYARDQGWTLKDCVTIDTNEKTCCLLGAVAIKKKIDFSDPIIADDVPVQIIGQCIGMTYLEVAGLVGGFDGAPCDLRRRYPFPEAYAVGKRFREKYLKGADK